MPVDTREQNRPTRDPIGAVGRGMTMLLALTLPFHTQLERLELTNTIPLPVVSILALLTALAATAKLIRGDLKLPRGWILFVLLFVLTGVSGFGAISRGGDALLTIAEIWSALILVGAVAVLYSGQTVERWGVLTAFVVSTFVASLLAVGQSLAIPGSEALVRMLGGSPDRWSLMPKANGPMENGELLAWTIAVLLPIVSAGVLAVEGKRRDIGAFVIAILWWAMLSTYSLIAPLAALIGVLMVVASRFGLKRSYPGIAVALLLGTLLALSNPVLRARWGRNPQPVNMVVRSATWIDEAVARDSLYFTLVNPGPMAWPRGFDVGYHIIYPAMDNEGPTDRLMRGGWVSRELQKKVGVGESVELVLPFIGQVRSGFISPDLRNGDGYLSTENPLKYVFLYRLDSRFGQQDSGTLYPVDQPNIVKTVHETLQRGQADKADRSREEVLQDAFSLMQARPLVGLGSGATKALLGYDSRSLFIETAVGYGWIGIGMLFVILAALNMGLLARNTLETIALSGTLLTLAIHGIVSYVHTGLSAVVFTSILAGLIWAAAFGPKEDETL